MPAAPYVLFVGQRSGYKNFEALLRAFAASERLKGDLRILCFGGGPLSTAELSLASELGLGSHHLSQLRGSDKLLGNAYAHAIALAYPSLYEGFGFPPLEAMSAGCPVLVSNTSSLPEVVGDAAIKFDPKNIEELRTAIERVTVSDEVRRELIAAGHERRKQFSWPRCVERTIDVYRKLV